MCPAAGKDATVFNMLHDFVRSRREEIISRARARLEKRTAPRATEAELENGVPLFLDNLIEVLQARAQPPGPFDSATTDYGRALRRTGFTVAQVVHDYGDICQAITELAVFEQAEITTSEFQILNLSLDHAIALAVSGYQEDREHAIADDETKRLGFFAHELRNRLSAASMAFEAIRRGDVAIGGSTGAVLGRNLAALRDLINRTLAQVRLDSGHEHKDTFMLSAFIEEVEIDALMHATGRGVELTLTQVANDVDLYADRQLLAAAVANLLQNALKFTPRGGHVAMRTSATADRIQIDIEDECGGLPEGEAEDLFRPFEQRSENKQGLGLGLSIVQRSVELHGGVVRVQNMPGKGCIFTIDVPRRT